MRKPSWAPALCSFLASPIFLLSDGLISLTRGNRYLDFRGFWGRFNSHTSIHLLVIWRIQRTVCLSELYIAKRANRINRFKQGAVLVSAFHFQESFSDDIAPNKLTDALQRPPNRNWRAIDRKNAKQCGRYSSCQPIPGKYSETMLLRRMRLRKHSKKRMLVIHELFWIPILQQINQIDDLETV